MALPNNIGMTVYLNVRYKAPTLADQFLVVKTRLNRVSGRKAFVEGEIYDLQGKRLVECDALYVEPKVRRTDWEPCHLIFTSPGRLGAENLCSQGSF